MREKEIVLDGFESQCCVSPCLPLVFWPKLVLISLFFKMAIIQLFNFCHYNYGLNKSFSLAGVSKRNVITLNNCIFHACLFYKVFLKGIRSTRLLILHVLIRTSSILNSSLLDMTKQIWKFWKRFHHGLLLQIIQQKHISGTK